MTFLREGTVAVEHGFIRRKRRYFSGVESVARFSFGIVDGHEDTSSNAGSLRMDRSGAKHCGDGGVDGIATLNQNVPIICFLFCFFSNGTLMTQSHVWTVRLLIIHQALFI